MQQQSHLLETLKSYKRTKSIAARFRPIYVCVDCLPFPISFNLDKNGIRLTKLTVKK